MRVQTCGKVLVAGTEAVARFGQMYCPPCAERYPSPLMAVSESGELKHDTYCGESVRAAMLRVKNDN